MDFISTISKVIFIRFTNLQIQELSSRVLCPSIIIKKNLLLRFAELTAAVFINENIPVYLYSKMTATPFVPFCVARLNALCGVMVTASHNPKEDNGYKVYWTNSAQIIPPHDKNIQNSIMINRV